MIFRIVEAHPIQTPRHLSPVSEVMLEYICGGFVNGFTPKYIVDPALDKKRNEL